MPSLKKELLIIFGCKSGKGQSGTSLYLAIIVMVILLAIVLGLTAILVGQMRMVREIGYSVIALSAADAGIERILVYRESPFATSSVLSNNATYTISVLPGELTPPPDLACTHPDTDWHYCITSIGEYQGVRRGIEIAY